MILDLKELRKSIDVSQAMLSELLNISQYRLSGIELKKEKATDLEIKCILDTIEKIKEGQIVPRKKKEYQKKHLTVQSLIAILDDIIVKQLEMTSI